MAEVELLQGLGQVLELERQVQVELCCDVNVEEVVVSLVVMMMVC